MKNQDKKQYSSKAIVDGNIWEMVYSAKDNKTAFVGLEEGKIAEKEKINTLTGDIYPFAETNKLVIDKVVLLPSWPEEYGDETHLLEEIRVFIHKYLEVSDFIEKISPFYVLFSWCFDSFKELPYLRALGDYGCGKSRFLKVIGSICYKPTFTGGAPNPAPIFRIIDKFRGTLVIDEADMKFSDTNSEVVKILNNGFQEGMPVIRCESRNLNIDPVSYNVFCPKIVATRERFTDKALESRFIVEVMDGNLTREDIPINLDDDFEIEALNIRNKCLMWRLLNYGKKKLDTSFQDRSIEPRLNQMITPLISIIENLEIKKELMQFIKKYNEELILDRGMSFEAPILSIILGLIETGDKVMTMQEIATQYNMNVVKGEKELSPRKIGYIIKEKFGLRTRRIGSGYVLDTEIYKHKIKKLKKKYGVEDTTMNLVNIVNVVEEDPFVKEVSELQNHPIPNF